MPFILHRKETFPKREFDTLPVSFRITYNISHTAFEVLKAVVMKSYFPLATFFALFLVWLIIRP
jgi:hypothetical protein